MNFGSDNASMIRSIKATANVSDNFSRTTFTHKQSTNWTDIAGINDTYKEYLLRVMYWNGIFNSLFISICLPFILVGNVMIILSVIKFPKLQTIMNLFITSLAFSDFLVAIPTIPFYITFYADKSVHSIKYFCLLKYCFVLISLPASILNLLIVTVDRFIAVVYPLHYKILMTKQRARLMISVVWFYSVGSATMPLMGLNLWADDMPCDFWKILPKPYTMVTVPGIIVTSLPLISLMYIKIFIEARKNTIRINKYKSDTQFQNKRLKRDTRAAKVMAFVFLLFILFWFPFLMASLLKYFNFHFLVIEMIKQCTVSFAMANSLVDPIIYCWVRVDFRHAFKKLLFMKGSVLRNDTYKLPEESNSKSNSVHSKSSYAEAIIVKPEQIGCESSRKSMVEKLDNEISIHIISQPQINTVDSQD